MAELVLGKLTNLVALVLPPDRVLEITPMAVAAAGLDRDDVVGRPLAQAPLWLARSDGDQVALLLSRAARGTATSGTVRTVVRTGAESGAMHVSVRPLRGADGHVALLLVEGHPDSGAAGDAPQDPEDAVARQVERVYEQRHRLVADLSHDLRAPLLSIVARAARLTDAATSDGMRREMTELRATALYALKQIEELRDVVALEHRRTTVLLQDADVVEVVGGILAQFEPLAAELGTSLVVRSPASLMVRVDEDKLSSIVSNLVANAVRYAPGGTVRVQLEVAGDQLRLEVADSGQGIPLEDRVHAFQRSWRAATTRRHFKHGHGIGLSIVREMVGLQGGSVEIDSAPEGGASVVVCLPLILPSGDPPRRTLEQLAASEFTTELVLAALHADLAREADRAPPSDG
jgi:signal transduction histidine kinase